MGADGKRFQASVRSARIGNFRGSPSSGTASRVVTRILSSEPFWRRRTGSKRTTSPAKTGMTPPMVPRIIAAASLRKFRRCGLEESDGAMNGFFLSHPSRNGQIFLRPEEKRKGKIQTASHFFLVH